MSVEAMVWALRDAPGVPAHCVGVLTGLGHHADRQGRGAFPSEGTLAAYARKSERQIRYDLAALTGAGLIREGDQSRAASLPPHRRPVVYDLAMERVGDADGGQSASTHMGGNALPPGNVLPPWQSASTHTSPDLPESDGGQSASTHMGGNAVRDGWQPTSTKPSINKYNNKNSLPESSSDDAEPAALFDAPAPKPSRRAARPSATRIPPDFAIDDAMRAWAVKSVPGYDFEAETENFIDWWSSKGGAAAEKVDWPATWRTWMRRNAKDAPPAQRRARQNGREPYRNPTDQSVYDRGFADD